MGKVLLECCLALLGGFPQNPLNPKKAFHRHWVRGRDMEFPCPQVVEAFRVPKQLRNWLCGVHSVRSFTSAPQSLFDVQKEGRLCSMGNLPVMDAGCLWGKKAAMMPGGQLVPVQRQRGAGDPQQVHLSMRNIRNIILGYGNQTRLSILSF